MPVLFLLRHRRGHSCLAALALACVLFASPGWAAPGFSFPEAMRWAVERAPALAAQRSRIAAAEEEAARAAALPDPKLTIGMANWPVTGGDAFDFRADDMTMKQVGVMQEFPARAKRHAHQELADRAIEQAQALSLAEQLAVRRAAAEAWITLWAAQCELGALQALREQSMLAVRIAKARLPSASGTATDVLATQAAVLELESRIDAAGASVNVARGTLARWLGEEPAALTTTGAPPDFNTLPVSEATLLASVDRQGPLLPWRSRESVAEAEVALAAAEKRPDWSVGVTYGRRERSPAGVPRSDMLMVEFAIDLPLFARNRQDRGIAARRAELEAVAAEHEDARRMQREAVHRALAEWDGLKRQVARKETEALPLARDRAQAAVASYGGGGALQPWLDARRTELELHIEHARHLGELGRVWAALAHLLPDQEIAR